MRRAALLFLLLPAGSFSVFASIDSGLLALVPPDAKVVSGIDLERARNSEFGQYLTAKLHNNGDKSSNKDFEEFVGDTGFDPRRDLQQIVLADTGQHVVGSHSNGVVLARGNFNQERITEKAVAKGFSPQTFQGVPLFVNPSDANGPSAFAFLGDGMAVLGDSAAVKKIIANRKAGAMLDPAMQAQISNVAADNDAWFVSFVSGDEIAAHFPRAAGANSANGSAEMPAQAQALKSVQQATGGMRFGTTVDLTFNAVTRSPQDATSLADVVRFFASVIQLQRQKDPRAAIAATAFDNMNLATDGNSLHLGISFQEKNLEQLLASGNSGVSFDLGAAAGHGRAQ